MDKDKEKLTDEALQEVSGGKRRTKDQEIWWVCRKFGITKRMWVSENAAHSAIERCCGMDMGRLEVK